MVSPNIPADKEQTLVHRSYERGGGEYGWLTTKYSFSFSNYYNPKRTGFGALLVLNDDTIAPGKGFDLHPHDNMEIITLVTQGSLKHTDSVGHEGLLHPNEVQVMSAGSGVYHSEFNASTTEVLKLFQIWIKTKKQNIAPRYAQKKFSQKAFVNTFTPIVSGKKSTKTLFIHQDAMLSLAVLDATKKAVYKAHTGKGVFVFIISGSVACANEVLHSRDSLEIKGSRLIEVTAQEKSIVLLIEVPLVQ